MYNIVIITPTKNAYSETFIRSHIDRLPANVKVLYGNSITKYELEDGTPLLSPFYLKNHFKFTIKHRINNISLEEFRNAQLVKFLNINNINAVLAEYGPTGVAVMDVCQKSHIPLIVHFHGYDAYHDDVLAKLRLRYLDLFNIAAYIISVSRPMTKQLLELGAPEEKIRLISYGVDLNKIQGANPKDASPLFVAVGRFVDKKSPLSTLFAFNKVLQSTPNAKLIMIGDGYLLESSKEVAATLGIAHTISFLGALPHDKVINTLKGARAFVQHSVRTSYGDSEGTPVAILEASAIGLPVISTRHAGIPDVIVDGETGYLVEERDINKMAEYMIFLAENPEIAEKLGKAGRRRIASEFSMDKSINDLWKIIEKAINNNSD